MRIPWKEGFSTQIIKTYICINLDNILVSTGKTVDEEAKQTKMLNLSVMPWLKQKITTYLKAI